MWYVIQTMVGLEQEVVDVVRKMIPYSCCQECFFISRECAQKISENYYQIYLAPLFPGYVFVITKQPEELFMELKRLPMLTKLLKSSEQIFLSVSNEEQKFLESIQENMEKKCNARHVVRRSLVKIDACGMVIGAKGAVGKYIDKIVKQRIRKRYVWIEQMLLGKNRRIVLGIKLIGDKEIE